MGEWKEYKIKDLGVAITGKTPSSNFPEEFGSDMPFITPTDYKYYGKWADYSDRGLSQKGIEKLQNKVLPPNSVLVTCIGSDMGKVVLNKVPVITNQQINSVIPNQELVAPVFLYYKIVDSYETLRMYSQAGTAVPILNKGDFEEIMSGTSYAPIGQVTETEVLEIYGLNRRRVMATSLGELKEAWQRPLRW